MTPFDDRNDDPLPEELESQNQALTRALSRAYQRSEQLTAAEQGESVARVRERLLLAHRPAQQEDVSEQQTGTADSTPLNPIMPTTFKPQRRIVRFVNGLAAVLVIGAIIGASVLLFTRHTSPTTAIRKLPAGSSDTSGLTVVASSTADGLTMSLAITPGPYFLSEMLAVKVTLTNNSQKNAYPGLPFSGGSCGYYPGVEITYTGNPQFTIPIAFDHSCPYNPARPATLKPGQTMSFLGYIPLQQSGQLTLTSPADCRIPFKVQGYNAIVEAPLSARGPLLYAYSIGCQDYNNDGGSTWSGNFSWDTLTNATVRRPGCPGKNLQWSFAFAIPGYAVAVGSDNDPIKS